VVKHRNRQTKYFTGSSFNQDLSFGPTTRGGNLAVKEHVIIHASKRSVNGAYVGDVGVVAESDSQFLSPTGNELPWFLHSSR
jgi:hypothetical protein